MTEFENEPAKYIYNPLTNSLDPYVDQPGVTSTTIEELTNGRVVLAGTMLWDTINSRAIGDIRPTQDNIFVNYPSGHLEHYVEVPTSEINTRYYTKAGYAVGAEFDVFSPSAKQYHFDLDYSKVAPPGRQLYLRNPDDWREGYRWVEYIPGMSDYLMDTQGDIWNRATQEETVQYMLRGLIYGKYEEVLREMVDEGMEDEYGKRLETISDAAAFIVRTNLSNVTAARFTYIQGDV